jgi:hypothetical protein
MGYFIGFNLGFVVVTTSKKPMIIDKYRGISIKIIHNDMIIKLSYVCYWGD